MSVTSTSSGLGRPEPVCGMDSWVPTPARVLDVRRENFNTHTLDLEIVEEPIRRAYRWAPGQFNMLYVPGVGEAAVSISSDPDKPGRLSHTIRVVGSVTRSILREAGSTGGGVVGLRGPFGVGWPTELVEGKDVVMMSGGIGLAPLRPMIYWLLSRRDVCRRLILLFGCRTPDDRVFVDELEQWAEDPRIDVLVTVDNANADWTGPVGVVTNLLRRVKVQAERSVVMVCGPRILNRVAAWNFLQLYVPPTRVFVSLERNMNCGFGRCGHCQYGSKFVCKDGPVFRFDQIADIFAKEQV